MAKNGGFRPGQWAPEDPSIWACVLSNIIFGAASTLVTVPQVGAHGPRALARYI